MCPTVNAAFLMFHITLRIFPDISLFILIESPDLHHTAAGMMSKPGHLLIKETIDFLSFIP